MDSSMPRVGGICSIATGISYALVGILFDLLPTAQRGGPPSGGACWASVATDPTAVLLLNWDFGLGSLFAFGAIIAITDRLDPQRSDTLVAIGAGLGGIVATIWFIWLGVALYRRAAPLAAVGNVAP